MPTHIRAQIGWQVDSMLPRDVQCINPCFRHSSDLVFDDPNWQTLADDLKTAITTWQLSSLRQLTVKLYEIKDPVEGVPNRPKAISQSGVGTSAATAYPGEISVCLSFYGGPNGPSNRGRLYVPYFAMTASNTKPGNRPLSGERTKAADLAPLFAALGGVNVDWIVWSPTKKAATKVTNYFVDDEFDTQRRRGLKPTTRTSGTTSG